MIDEYQDTNKLQANIACLLASEHQNIMVVGDDSQSIYSFRGANFRNIMDFPKIFPNTKIITIAQNYRSTQPLLDLTNEIIKFAKEKYSKVLFTDKEGNQKPVFIETQSENYQSKFIVQRCLELREEGVSLDDIAVLFRNGWHSNDLEIELASHNIPFVKYGGFKFIETAHVKDVIAHLKAAFNPLDAVSWHRILLLIEGIGPKTSDKIIFEIVNNKKEVLFLKKEKKFSNKKFRRNLNKLFSLIEKIKSKEIVPVEQIKILLEYYRPLLENKYDDFNKRLNDLDSLVTITERYNNLEHFLVDIALEPLETSRVSRTTDKEKEKLILSTIHSAKGLEWHTVFVISVVDGYLPSSYSLDSEEAIEEERRLLYVATTRAKENLYLLKPNIEHNGRSYFEQSYSGFSKISRFLDEFDILEKYVEKWALVDEQKEEVVGGKIIRPKKKSTFEKIKSFFSK